MLKKIGFGILALALSANVSFAQSVFSQFPTIGVPDSTECLSYGNNSVCNQYRPAGPTTLTGNETVPANTNLSGGGQPQSVLIDVNTLGAGAITFNSTTGTGQNPVVTNGVSNYFYTGAGTATFATFTFPSAPSQGQRLCLYNAGTGILTLTSLVATGKTLVGTTPTSIPVAVASGAQATVTNAGICYLYDNPTLSWYRFQ